MLARPRFQALALQPFFLLKLYLCLLRRAGVELSGYEEPVFVRMLGRSKCESHDDELRIHRGLYRDDIWAAHTRQMYRVASLLTSVRLPRCHVYLAGDGDIVLTQRCGDEVLSAYIYILQPLFSVAPNFAQCDEVKVFIRYGFAYHAFQVVLVLR